MTVLERLKLDLNKQDYFTDKEYTQFLLENGLDPADKYNKDEMEKQLLLSTISVLEAVSNDIDTMRKIVDESTGLTITDCYKWLCKRIDTLKNKLATMEVQENEFCSVRPLFFR